MNIKNHTKQKPVLIVNVQVGLFIKIKCDTKMYMAHKCDLNRNPDPAMA